MSTYESVPARVEAVRWCGDGCPIAPAPGAPHDGYAADQIVAWVNDNGGEVEYLPLWPFDESWKKRPCIAVCTIDGWAYATPGDYVVMGSVTFPNPAPEWRTEVLLEFYPVKSLSEVRVEHKWRAVW